ncbi:hypothetical protein CEXT_575801, partial [Caerostris extrusa]
MASEEVLGYDQEIPVPKEKKKKKSKSLG